MWKDIKHSTHIRFYDHICSKKVSYLDSIIPVLAMFIPSWLPDTKVEYVGSRIWLKW
jgi:hypothetical protein